MTYDDWDIRTDDEAHEYCEAARRAYRIAADRQRFLQAQEDRDTGNELDPLLFEEPEEEA
jgi:hypothetical protein